MNDRLLPSKLHVPGNRPGTLSRGRLFAPLNDALHDQHRLILISAPAGSGKTTLVSQWITQNDLSCAWVALDDDDNDLARFTHYLIAATAKALAASDDAIFPDDLVPESETIWHDFVNALLAFDIPMVIVLDDYHLIKTEIIHDGITFLMEHLPPHVRLVLVTRSDPPLPIARLRVCQQITELREYDIRFTPPEAHDFLNVTSGLHIDDDGVEALHERTEGWIAGLQLAALSLRRYADPTEFISQFTGSHRFVLDYLTEEVLNHQNTETQAFLLKTSILDRLAPDLCQAVSGNADSHEMLDTLCRNNLFWVPLDTIGLTYRYHHLLSDLLRVRLQQKYADDLPDLHQRAAAWYVKHDDVLSRFGTIWQANTTSKPPIWSSARRSRSTIKVISLAS